MHQSWHMTRLRAESALASLTELRERRTGVRVPATARGCHFMSGSHNLGWDRLHLLLNDAETRACFIVNHCYNLGAPGVAALPITPPYSGCDGALRCTGRISTSG